jgi:class 3 adenylate cyclase
MLRASSFFYYFIENEDFFCYYFILLVHRAEERILRTGEDGRHNEDVEMKVNRQLQNLLVRALSESMSPHTMQKITRRIIPNYDLQERTGFPTNIPITGLTAANQVMLDVIEEELFLKFITVLIDVTEEGLMGTKLKIKELPLILSELKAEGIAYDGDRHQFMELKGESTSKGWRVLEEGNIYDFTFLRLDIVKNSELVRNHERETIMEVYNDLKDIVRKHVEKRNGRIWGWEGDGVLVAFFFDEKNIHAVLSGIDILLNLFLYNEFECKLGEPLLVRMAIHAGPCPFRQEINKHQSETIARLEQVEGEYTLPDSLTLTPSVYQDLGTKLEQFFEPVEVSAGNCVYRFKMRWEE